MKIVKLIQDSDNEAVITIVLFIVGIIVAFLGTTILTVSSAVPFMVFGGMVIALGVAFVLVGFVTLITIISNM